MPGAYYWTSHCEDNVLHERCVMSSAIRILFSIAWVACIATMIGSIIFPGARDYQSAMLMFVAVMVAAHHYSE